MSTTNDAPSASSNGSAVFSLEPMMDDLVQTLRRMDGSPISRQNLKQIVLTVLKALETPPPLSAVNRAEGREPERTLSPLTFTLQDSFPRIVRELRKDLEVDPGA